jgi:alkanesulfonate monooxygenase SsuD/methylene tetrahydromethanopterin reductase-like flavin-dependent oxidoreductase (luciferase family)
MRVGISLTSSHVTRNTRDAARWMIERAAAAERAGLDSLFIGDHHSTPAPYYQNVPMLGRLLAEWGDRPAGCLFLLPLWNPVLLAEQVGTLATIARGRFIMQCALGADRGQFTAMGVDIKQRPSRFEQSLDIIRRLWAGQTVTSTAGRFEFTDAKVSPVPPEPVDVWIGGSTEASVDRAARLGEAYLAGPELTPEKARSWAAFYLERCRNYGRTPSAVAIRRDVFVGDTQSAAEAVVEPVLARGYRGIDRSALVFGGVEEVAATFRSYESMGYTDVIVRHITNDQDAVLGSIRQLAALRDAVK